MAYCDFNPRLFKEFTSMKVKVQPAMSDDWEMVPSQYVKIGGFSLKSKKLNQEVADINLLRFLDFCKKENLVIEGLKLKGNFIIGNDRSVYTEEMYNTWRDKYEVRTETIIEKDEYKIGHRYKTPCGAELIYLGEKYMTKIKDDDYTNITKPTKKFYTLSPDAKNLNDANYNVTELKQKFSKDLGQELTEEECKVWLRAKYERNQNIVGWEDERIPKDVQYGIIDFEFTIKHSTWDGKEYCSPLMFEDSNGVLYSSEYSSGCDLRLVNGEWTSTWAYPTEREKPGRSYGGWNRDRKEKVAVKFKRMGIIKEA